MVKTTVFTPECKVSLDKFGDRLSPVSARMIINRVAPMLNEYDTVYLDIPGFSVQHTFVELRQNGQSKSVFLCEQKSDSSVYHGSYYDSGWMKK